MLSTVHLRVWCMIFSFTPVVQMCDWGSLNWQESVNERMNEYCACKVWFKIIHPVCEAAGGPVCDHTVHDLIKRRSVQSHQSKHIVDFTACLFNEAEAPLLWRELDFSCCSSFCLRLMKFDIQIYQLDDIMCVCPPKQLQITQMKTYICFMRWCYTVVSVDKVKAQK